MKQHLIDKYLIKEDIHKDQKTLMDDVKLFVSSKSVKLTQNSKGKYIEQTIKCKNNKHANEFKEEFKEHYKKKGFHIQNAPMISPTKEYRFINDNQVLVMFLDYTNVSGYGTGSKLLLYFPKSNK